MYSEQGLLVLEDSEKLSAKQVALCETFKQRVEAAAKDWWIMHEVKDGRSIAKRVLGKECERLAKEQDKLRQSHLRLIHFIDSLEKELDETSTGTKEETKPMPNPDEENEEMGVVMVTLPIPLAIIKAIHDDLCK